MKACRKSLLLISDKIRKICLLTEIDGGTFDNAKVAKESLEKEKKIFFKIGNKIRFTYFTIKCVSSTLTPINNQ